MAKNNLLGKLFAFSLLVIALLGVVQAGSVIGLLFYSDGSSSTKTITDGDSLGFYMSADSIYDSPMNIKVDLIKSGRVITELVNVNTNSESWTDYYTIKNWAYDGPGIYTIKQTVTGKSGTKDTDYLYFNVNKANTAPTISNIPDQNVNEGSSFSYQVIASDIDGDELSYTISGPNWLGISSSGLISGNAPQVSSDTSYSVTVSVSDGKASVSDSFTLLVRDVPTVSTNNAPTISNIPDQNVNEGSSFSYQVIASDIDGDSLTYTLVSGPNWLSINSNTGLLSGTAALVSSDTTITITVEVSDGSLSDSASFDLTIRDVNNGGNNGGTTDTTPPVVDITAPLASDDSDVDSETLIYFTDSEITNPEVSIDGSNWVSAISGVTTLGDVPGFNELENGSAFTLYLRDIDAAGNLGTDNEPGLIKSGNFSDNQNDSKKGSVAYLYQDSFEDDAYLNQFKPKTIKAELSDELKNGSGLPVWVWVLLGLVILILIAIFVKLIFF